MKAFIYRKDNSEKVATLEHVAAIQKSKNNELVFITDDGEGFSTDIKKYKIVIYQN